MVDLAKEMAEKGAAVKERYGKMPGPLRKQALLRCAGGTAFFVLFVMVQMHYWDIGFSLPCLFLACLAFISGGRLLFYGVNGKCICVEGICTQIETAGARKRMKSIRMDTGTNQIRIWMHRTSRKITRGELVAVYLTETAPVYKRDGEYVIFSYYALETKKDVSGKERTRESEG